MYSEYLANTLSTLVIIIKFRKKKELSTLNKFSYVFYTFKPFF